MPKAYRKRIEKPQNPRVRLNDAAFEKWSRLKARYSLDWVTLADWLADDALAGRPFTPDRTAIRD